MLLGFLQTNLPAVLVIALSLVIGFLMVVVFRYVSDQEAIHLVKDQIKAHLLAVRLYRDQLPVVLASYTRIFAGTSRYLRLAFRPLLFLILPLTFLIVQVDRYLAFVPLQPGHPFLIKAHTTADGDGASLQTPPGMAITAPAVHIPATGEIVWRVVAEEGGHYDVHVLIAGHAFTKRVVVSSGLARLSPVRLRGPIWERMFISAEPALPETGPVQSIEVDYPSRSIDFAFLRWNWIWLFLVLSVAAGLFFKAVLGIEI